MSKKLLILANMELGQLFADMVNVYMGPYTGATTGYTVPVKYLNSDKGMVLVCSKCYSIMTPEQIASLKTRDEVRAEGGLPEIVN